MEDKMKRILIAVLLSLITVPAFAQTQNFTPDDRYKGYPSTLISWPTARPNVTACVAGEYYEPVDTHLTKYADRVKVARVRVQQYDECTFMLTSKSWRWVLRPAGTKVAVDAQGRDLFDYGSPKGRKCANPRPFAVAIAPKVTEVEDTPVVKSRAFEIPEKTIDIPQPKVVVPIVEEKPVEEPKKIESRISKGGLIFTLGVRADFFRVNYEYSDPIPDRGDVHQNHNGRGLVVFGRFDQSEMRGIYFSGEATVAADDDTMLYDDLQGNRLDKNRDSDSSKDKLVRIYGGYKHDVGEKLTVGGHVGYQRWGTDEKYRAQGADTTTKLFYAGMFFGGEATVSSERFSVRVTGDYGPSMNRTSSTHQVYGSIDFPEVNHPNEKAKMVDLRATAEIRLTGPLNLVVAAEHLGINSTRPESFTAHEHVSNTTLSVGVALKWGKK
jgi:hypothetical protein